MSLFNRNKSGRTFDGKESDRKGFIDPIRWNMTEGEIVYKYPYDNITTGAVLSVNESQQAFLYKNGTLYDSFGNGKHELTTANIPFLQKFLNLPTGGETVFTAEVWFVNTELVKRNVPWGVGEMEIIDPYYKIPVEVRARGQYGFKISDGAVFLKKMVGTLHSVTTEKIYEQFIKSVKGATNRSLLTYIETNDVSILKIGSHMENIEKLIKQNLSASFEEYGIELLNLDVEYIGANKDNVNYKKIQDALSERAKIETLGNRYETARQFDVMDKAAVNEGIAGGAMGAGLGAGLGFGMGGMMGNQQQQSQQQSQQPQHQPPPQSSPPPPGGAAPPTPAVAAIYLSVSGETYGPYTIEQLKEFAKQNSFTKESLVWKTGMENWVKAAEMPELMAVFAKPGAPPPPPPK